MELIRTDRHDRRELPADIAVGAVWFGILTGFAEVIVLGVNKLVFHEMVFQSPDVVWMAPVGALALFSIAALLMSIAALYWPRFVTLGRACGVFVFLGCLSVLLMFDPRLSRYASTVLALGVAITVARLIDGHPGGFRKLLTRTRIPPATPEKDTEQNVLDRRRFLLTAGSTLAVTAAGVQAWQWLGELQAASTRRPAQPGVPNVLLVVLDTVRAQSVSLDGLGRATTPRLAALARAGTSFQRAHSAAPWTLPSHASMFTGRHPHELSADWLTPLDATFPTLPEVLRTHGYSTAGFASNTDYVSRESGLSRGFTHFEDYGVSVGETILSSSIDTFLANSALVRDVTHDYDILGRKRASNVNAAFLDWLGGIDRKPFFAFLNYFDAHEPYLPPAPFDSQFGDPALRNLSGYHAIKHGAGRLSYASLSPQQVQAEMAAYEGSIAYMDFHLGALLDELQRRAVLDNTLVIVTADHGEEFGEHGVFTHGNSLYLPALWVPLVLRLPGHIPPGVQVADTVGLRDLARTVLDVAGIQEATDIPGTSLSRFWNATPAATPAGGNQVVLCEVSAGIRKDPSLPVAKGPMSSLVGDDYHYIRRGDGQEELFHIGRDPWEQQDLSQSPRERAALDQFRTSLQAIVPARVSA